MKVKSPFTRLKAAVCSAGASRLWQVSPCPCARPPPPSTKLQFLLLVPPRMDNSQLGLGSPNTITVGRGERKRAISTPNKPKWWGQGPQLVSVISFSIHRVLVCPRMEGAELAKICGQRECLAKYFQVRGKSLDFPPSVKCQLKSCQTFQRGSGRKYLRL